jgi:hypothetical protein
MARKKGAETLRKFWRLRFTGHLVSLAIIMLSLLMLALSSCARGGGTPIPEIQEAGVFDSSSINTTPVADTGPEAAEGPFCGNGKLEPQINEQCDREDLGGATCVLLSNGQEDGTLTCTPDCKYNTTMCYPVISQAGSGAEDPAMAGNYGGP